MMKFLKNKWIRFGLIPLFLLLIGIFISFLHIQKIGEISILLYPFHRNNFISWNEGELLKGKKVLSEFRSPADNLGIVSVRFNTFARINSDSIIFRIKEKGQNKWYYTNIYLTDQFQPDELFTFGFPIIENSEGRSYQFELESKKGSPEDAVALSNNEPIFVTKHQFAKSSLLSDSNAFKEFIYRKILTLFADTEFIISSLINFLPLILYMAYLFLLKRYLNTKDIGSYAKNATDQTKNIPKKYRFVFVPLFFILLDAFFVNQVSHTSIVVIMTTWAIILSALKLESRASFVVALFFLGLCPLLLIISLDTIAEKAALWAYMFLLIGVIHQIWDLRKMPPSKI